MTRRAPLVWLAVAATFPAAAPADQASAPGSTAAAGLDAGDSHTCAVLAGGRVRCWGFNRNGQLGYGNEATVGDDEAPGARGPVDLGAGRTATSIAVGNFHSCAVLDDSTVRCWGSGIEGQLARLQNLTDLGDNESPASAPPIDLGSGRTAKAITAGGGHSCAILDDSNLRCWGYGYLGRLGYGNQDAVGTDQTPGSVGPVSIGAGRTAVAVTAGNDHTCALLDDGNVRCWGQNTEGQLGYGNTAHIGDDELPSSVAPVNLGQGRTATAISAGRAHTCAVLDDGSVRCWGDGAQGQLGYGNTADVGDTETPASVPPVDLGLGRTATAIAAGRDHTCALLDQGDVRCWGEGQWGALGLGGLVAIGDTETPASVPTVALGGGRHAVALALGARHTCARLDDAGVRCWGYAENGRLGYCSTEPIGDDEEPAAAGPVALLTTTGGGCLAPSPPIQRPPPGTGTPAQPSTPSLAAALRAQATRRRRFLACRSEARRHAARETRRARRMPATRRTAARRHIRRHRSLLLRACARRHGRTPGRVSGLRGRASSSTRVELTFGAAGTDGGRPPAARAYVVKQSRRPIRSARGFRRAQTLCGGSCRFRSAREVGARLAVSVTDLRPRTTYYYAIAARDNVSGRLGRRSVTVRVRTPG